MPVEPPATRWVFPDPALADDDLVAIGADLEPGTLLSAYRGGLFPMPMPGRVGLGWFCPIDRAVLPIDRLRVTRSMRRSAGRYRVTVDRAFSDVVKGCADPGREGGWIDPAIIRGYRQLHELGWAHSVDVWDAAGELAGGLYGVSIGGLFCGESMFHRSRDASKVALMALVELLSDGVAGRLLDVQWSTSHLASLGVVEIGRTAYLERLGPALLLPGPAAWTPPDELS